MPNFDPFTYRYSSRRNVVYAKTACAAHPFPSAHRSDSMY